MTSRIPFFSLESERTAFDGEVTDAILRVVRSRQYILGPEVERFEAMAGEYLGVRHAVGVSSGTDALVMALAAVGVGPGDEVVTTPFSFVATAEAIVRTGAVPRLVDVTEDSLCLDAAGVERAMTPRVRAILPVHLFGHAADVRELAAAAERRGVALVEDAAQALGSRIEGRALGTWGKVGSFSFFPTKVLGALGDAGLVVTDDAETAATLRSLRQHGLAAGGSGHYVRLGGNYRMDALHAAALSALLPRLQGALEKRRAVAARYDAALEGVEGLERVRCRRYGAAGGAGGGAPPASGSAPAGVRPVGGQLDWNAALYTVRIRGGCRDAVREHLAQAGIETRVYYESPLHLQPVFASLGYGVGSFPVAEQAAREVLSLPIYPGLAEEDVERVVAAVRAFRG